MKKFGREFWLIVLLTLVGAALRVADLTGRSMWLDEGFTLARLQGSWLDIFTNVVVVQGIQTIDLHPPLYFALLKIWGMLAGNSEYALKLLSVLASILLLPVTYSLARRMFNKRVAFLAVILALLSPTYQYYAHELRMYTIVPLLSALTSYAIYVAQKPGRNRRYAWTAWFVLTIVSVLTHYALLGVCVAQMLYLGIVVITRRSHLDPRGAVILSVAVMVLVFGTAKIGGVMDNGERIRQIMTGQLDSQRASSLPDMATSFTQNAIFGPDAVDPTGGALILFLIVVCLVAPLFPNRLISLNMAPRTFLRARVFTWLLVVIPIVLLFLAALVVDRWTTFRYSITAMPAMQIGLAYIGSLALHGLHTWLSKSQWRLALRHVGDITFAAISGIAFVVVIAAQITGFVASFVRTSAWQDDWRSAAQYIRDQWIPGDVMLIDLTTPEDVLRLYLYDLPIIIVPVVQLPASKPELTAFLRQYRRVWHVNTGRSPINTRTVMGQVLLTMMRREPVKIEVKTHKLVMDLFDTAKPFTEQIPASAHVITQTVENDSHPSIAAYAIEGVNPYHRYPNFRLVIYWRRPTDLSRLGEYSLAVRLKSADGRTWSDWFISARLKTPPSYWSDTAFMRQDYVVPIPVGLPRQTYWLEMSPYIGEKAEVVNAVPILLGLSDVDCCVRITHWTSTDVTGHEPVTWQTVGAVLTRVEFPAIAMPGSILPVALTWKLEQPVNADWQTRLNLEGMLGGTVTESLSPTGTDEAPLAKWTTGEPMRSMHALIVPPTTRPGLYRLKMSRVFSDGRGSDSAALGWVEVKEFSFTPVVAAMPSQVSGKVSELTLLGYALDQPFKRNATLRFQLSWQVESPPLRDGVLFLHVTSRDGKLIAQDDNPPEQGKRSTQTYRAGEGIQQLHRLAIPPDAPGGEYRLYAGVYNRDDIVRWSAQQNGAAAQDDLLFLGTFTLPELPNYRYKIYVPLVSQGQ